MAPKTLAQVRSSCCSSENQQLPFYSIWVTSRHQPFPHIFFPNLEVFTKRDTHLCNQALYKMQQGHPAWDKTKIHWSRIIPTCSLPQIRFLGGRFSYRMTLSCGPSVSAALFLFTKQSLPLSLKFTLDMPAVLAIRAGEAHCSCFPLCLLCRSISHRGPKRQNIDFFFS